MAFDFQGTFRTEEWNALVAFTRAQEPGIAPRVEAIRMELQRIGWIEYEKAEDGTPISFEVRPSSSLLAQHVQLYQYYGGDPLELWVRSRGDWIYITKGEFTLTGDTDFAGGFTSAPRQRGYQTNRHLDDATVGNAVDKVKGWQREAIRKIEDLEYQIKRTIDHGDQLINEALLLVKRSSGAESLESLLERVDAFIASPDYPSAGFP